MKSIKATVAMFLAGCIVTACGVKVPLEYYVVDGPINVRSGPGTEHKRIFSLSTGDVVRELKREPNKVKVGKWEGHWVNIEHKGKQGWMLSTFLSLKTDGAAAPEKKETVEADAVIESLSSRYSTPGTGQPGSHSVLTFERSLRDGGNGFPRVTVLYGEGGEVCNVASASRVVAAGGGKTYEFLCNKEVPAGEKEDPGYRIEKMSSIRFTDLGEGRIRFRNETFKETGP